MEDMGVEHASVEVNALIPTLQAFLPLQINVVVVSLVVGLPDVLVVIAGPERVQVIVPLVEVLVCLGTLGHTEFKEGQSLQHLVVS